MNIRWMARIVGVILLLVFFLVMANLQRRLVEMRHARKPAPTSTR